MVCRPTWSADLDRSVFLGAGEITCISKRQESKMVKGSTENDNSRKEKYS